MITPEHLQTEAVERYHLDPKRIEKAAQIAQGKTMIYNAHCKPGEFDVRSSDGKGWYHVNTKTKTCTCPDSLKGHTCKHRIAVWFFTQLRAQPIAELRRTTVENIMSELGYR